MCGLSSLGKTGGNKWILNHTLKMYLKYTAQNMPQEDVHEENCQLRG